MFHRLRTLLRAPGDSDRPVLNEHAPPDTPDAARLLRTAAQRYQAGQWQQAVELYQELLALHPDHAEACTGRGNALRELKRHDAALQDYDRAIRLQPDYAEAHFNKAIALQELGRFDEAQQSYGQAIRYRPDYASAYYNRGLILQALGRFEEAQQSYEQAIRYRADFALAWNNRGNALQELGRFNEALQNYEQAIRLQPDYAEAHNNKGAVLEKLERFDEALQSYDEAIRLQPDYAEAHFNKAIALQEFGRFDEAQQSYAQAIRLRPDYADAYLNMSILKLRMGDFEAGWKLYEWRWRGDAQKGLQRIYPQPLWLGEEPIAGKTIFVYAEQGLGDAIQMCRYLPMIEKLGARIIFETPASLIPLLSTLDCDCTLVERGQQPPPFDVYCPIMSLPLAFKTTLQSIPSEVPYLHADPHKRATWKQRLGEKGRLRAGLVWSGSTIHTNDRNRSVSLGVFNSLLELPVEFHSLQKEYREQDSILLGGLAKLKDHQQELADFADTAALISEMDLVISVDTSVAHLAGALGKEVWILLPFTADYRWLLDRMDSPWYPTATLFRQPARGDWVGVIDQVRERLEGMAD